MKKSCEYSLLRYIHTESVWSRGASYYFTGAVVGVVMSDSLPVLNFRLTPKVSTPSPRSSPGTNIHSSRSNISLPPPPAVRVLVGDEVGEKR